MMTKEELHKLEYESDLLYEKVQMMRELYDAAIARWAKVEKIVRKESEKAEMRAELESEIKAAAEAAAELPKPQQPGTNNESDHRSRSRMDSQPNLD